MKKIILIGILNLIFTLSVISVKKEKIMTVEQINIETIKLIPKMYNKDAQIAKAIFTHDCLHHINGSLENEKGPELIIKSILLMNKQFSNSKTTFNEIISNGDSIAVRWSWKAINPLSKKEWRFNGNTIFHLKNGKITEYWAIDDRYREMQSHGFSIVPPQNK